MEDIDTLLDEDRYQLSAVSYQPERAEAES
jgi:hypothetical protein